MTLPFFPRLEVFPDTPKLTMKQSEEKNSAVLPEENNRRHDWKRADIVERGIEMETDQGYSSAARFMEQHNIRPDIIERVLRQRLDRRNRNRDALS